MTTLTDEVADLIRQQDPDEAKHFIQTYDGDNSLASMNRYFRGVLTHSPISTMDERGCLLDDLDEPRWLDYLKNHVIPTLVRFKLIEKLMSAGGG